MSKDAHSKSNAKDLEIVGKVRVVTRNPRAKELHDGQVEVLARLIRKIAGTAEWESRRFDQARAEGEGRKYIADPCKISTI